MSVTKRQVPKFLRVSGRPSLSQQLMSIGLVITLMFVDSSLRSRVSSLGVAKSPMNH